MSANSVRTAWNARHGILPVEMNVMLDFQSVLRDFG